MRLELPLPMPKTQRASLDEKLSWLSELSEVVDAIPEVIATFDADGRLLFMNTAGLELVGYTSEEELERLILTDLFTDEGAEHVLNVALPEAVRWGTWSGHLALSTSRQTLEDANVHLVAHQPQGGHAGAFTIIARPEDVESSLRTAQESALRNRRELAATTALGLVHDMNNLVGPILAYSELAATQLPEGSPVLRYLEQIRRASHRAGNLAERLSALTREEPPACTAVDVGEILQEAVEWMKVSRPRHSIELHRRSEDATAWANPTQIHQVVMNLLRNATEALSDPTGAVTVDLEEVTALTPESMTLGRFLKITVSDDGCGMNEATLERAFEPFFSGHGRSGLGLSVCREIVDAHGGTLHVQTSPNEGSRFSFTLPVFSPGTEEND